MAGPVGGSDRFEVADEGARVHDETVRRKLNFRSVSLLMDAGEKYWSVLDPIWDNINIDSAESFSSTFETVPRDVAVLYAAHFCQSEVCNGGFTQFFSNSTGVLAPEAVEGFRAIGQQKVGDVVQRAISLLGPPYMRDRVARWAVLDNLRASEDRTAAPARGYQIRLFEPLQNG